MKIIREVEYDPDELEALTRGAMKHAASVALNATPGDGEEWRVHLSSYGTSRISIEKVEPPKPESEAQ